MISKLQTYVLLNGRLTRARAARISPLGEGFMFGRGLFETIKVRDGRPVFFREHAARLRRSAAALQLVLGASTRGLARRCARLIAANGTRDGSLKIVAFDDTEGPGELILTREGTYAPEVYARGFRLATAPDRHRPVAGFKTLNYLGNSVARRRALAAGFDEALFIDPSGLVLEGAGSNMFAVAGGRVITPPLTEGILPGVARAAVLRLIPQALRLMPHPLTLKRLLEADEVFVTNALLGVMPVSRIDRQQFDLGRNPVTRALAQAYRAAELRSASQRVARAARKSIAGA